MWLYKTTMAVLLPQKGGGDGLELQCFKLQLNGFYSSKVGMGFSSEHKKFFKYNINTIYIILYIIILYFKYNFFNRL